MTLLLPQLLNRKLCFVFGPIVSFHKVICNKKYILFLYGNIKRTSFSTIICYCSHQRERRADQNWQQQRNKSTRRDLHSDCVLFMRFFVGTRERTRRNSHFRKTNHAYTTVKCSLFIISTRVVYSVFTEHWTLDTRHFKGSSWSGSIVGIPMTFLCLYFFSGFIWVLFGF